MIKANDPNLKSWVTVPEGSDFPIQNLPFGIFDDGNGARIGVAIGDKVLDVRFLAVNGYLDDCGVELEALMQDTLNDFAAEGRTATRSVRNRISELLADGTADLRDNVEDRAAALIAMSDVKMLMPVHVGDYTDFYSSIEHATNVGTMFRDPNNALLPNWKHLPVGYHGRASSIIVSGSPIHRPKGQTKPKDDEPPVYGPCRLLDFELEMAFIVGKPTELGDTVAAADAEDHVFGMVIFNDWSARDIQKWEYIPLGPFLGKNFASSISPWVVTMDALEPFRVSGYEQDPKPLPYLLSDGDPNFDIDLEVLIQPDGQAPHSVCKSNYRYMYWSMRQQLAHHTVNGCNINAGDMCASGTISGPTPDTYGSMLELSWRGTKPIPMPDGSVRKFIADGDSVIMRAHCEKDGIRIGFGEVNTKVLPAK